MHRAILEIERVSNGATSRGSACSRSRASLAGSGMSLLADPEVGRLFLGG
jgi:hypothetical protein